jgi:hypothetical protein
MIFSITSFPLLLFFFDPAVLTLVGDLNDFFFRFRLAASLARRNARVTFRGDLGKGS